MLTAYLGFFLISDRGCNKILGWISDIESALLQNRVARFALRICVS